MQMKKLFTIDDFAVAFISALGYVKHYAAIDEEHRKSVANYDLFGDDGN